MRRATRRHVLGRAAAATLGLAAGGGLVAVPRVARAATPGMDGALPEEVPDLVAVSAGPFLYGSTRAERDRAYALDARAYGHWRTRELGWYESEPQLAEGRTGDFAITRTPVTNALYAAFVEATGHPAPDVDRATWEGYGLIHPYASSRRHAWFDGAPPPGREDHPVVLVSLADARAHAAWLSTLTGARWRLPDEREWEKAARGHDGRAFPWGDEWDAARLNSHDRGPFDTLPVGSFPEGASPHGLLDAAGQVFEWTETEAAPGRIIVKGGSWDDKGCGVCRPAARHARPADIRHILIGYRLVCETSG
ncbi:MAG: hypothetical protein CVT80_10920 [Alphaproteobacteria bacterium HGW-Alphaproteobacteria-2]|nr:MAG: hypothetical protein CVT80_10920 [Alphaproteobacteria bacterium HGW-Alphaproteobacteria-2]